MIDRHEVLRRMKDVSACEKVTLLRIDAIGLEPDSCVGTKSNQSFKALKMSDIRLQFSPIVLFSINSEYIRLLRGAAASIPADVAGSDCRAPLMCLNSRVNVQESDNGPYSAPEKSLSFIFSNSNR